VPGVRIAMLLHKSVEHDARVRREAKALQRAGHEVVVVHLPRPGSSVAGAAADGYELRTAERPEWLPGAPARAVAAAHLSGIAAAERPDVVHAHDAAMLAPGWLAARRCGARLVYDSHELATGVPYRSPAWAALVAGVERGFVRRADAVITVSDGIAERLQERYSLATRPTVVRNVPDLRPAGDPATPPADLRRRFEIDRAPLVLHHGAAAQDRGCENLVRALVGLDRAHLLFLGAGGPYGERLRALSETLGVAARTHFEPPVALDRLLAHTAQADVGVSLLEPSCDNHRLALPNKVFEYVAAGVPVVVSDLPELGRLVRAYEIGWAVDPRDPASIAAGLSAAIDAGADAALRERLSRAAGELNWEREQRRLLELYERLQTSPAVPVSAGSA
jgi:glycosyltransferase involved in cell wall biosynthesis